MHFLSTSNNKHALSNKFKHKSLLALFIAFLFISSSCGKRKPPVPPSERISQRVEISAFQRGNKVNLSWKMPARNASDGNTLNIERVDIYRLTEPITSTPILSEEEFASKSTLINSMPIALSDFGLKTLIFSDNLEFANQSARIIYAIRFVNSSGQKAAFSNFAVIEPTSKISKQPEALKALLNNDSIELSWAKPATNIDGTTPPNILGYNVYRSNSNTETAKLLNETPLSELNYNDNFFEFEKSYFYFVRTVSTNRNGEPIESVESEILKITPKDTFAPDPPKALTIAASPGSISVFFASSIEKDVVGYKIYRSIDPNKDKNIWTMLTTEPISVNTFQDLRVEKNQTYYYYITAIDRAGNVSEPSEIISEKAPE